MTICIDERCMNCGRDREVVWCYTWNSYLCPDCKIKRRDKDLNQKFVLTVGEAR